MKLSLINKLSSSVLAGSASKPAKSRMLSDFYGALADTAFPSADEIKEVVKDEDEDIIKFSL